VNPLLMQAMNGMLGLIGGIKGAVKLVEEIVLTPLFDDNVSEGGYPLEHFLPKDGENKIELSKDVRVIVAGKGVNRVVTVIIKPKGEVKTLV